MTGDSLEEAAAQLYGVPLEDFTRERDARARELRGDGRRDAAAEVARLPKPSQVAWAVNRLARDERARMDDLLQAGEDLRSAQEEALGGGDAATLRAAAAAERRAVDALVDAAAGLRPAARSMNRAALDRVRETLHAAAADEEVRARVAAGCMVKEAAGGGGWPLMAAASTSAPRERAPEARGKRAKETRAPRGRAPAGDEGAGTRKQQERARKQDERARKLEERALEREGARARREEAERAAAERRELLAELKQARARAAAARHDLEEARAADEAARDDVARLEERLG